MLSATMKYNHMPRAEYAQSRGWANMTAVIRIVTTYCICIVGIMSSPAWSQDTYPSKPIRMVVAFAPGGATDIVGRAFGKELEQLLGQPIVIDNRSGATGRIGSEIVARARPDGYTLILALTSTHAVLPALSSNMPYDAVKDFSGVIKIGEAPLTLIASSTLPFSTVRELVTYAKSNPGKLTYASSGIGSLLHLAGELFAQVADISIVHVPYKGSGTVLADMISGRVDIMFMPTPAPALETKRIKAIGITSRQRSASAPNLPTLSEGGVSGFFVTSWIGVMAPAGTPRPVIHKVNELGNQVLARPALRKRLGELSYEAIGGTPEAFEAAIRDDIAQFRKLNIKLE